MHRVRTAATTKRQKEGHPVTPPPCSYHPARRAIQLSSYMLPLTVARFHTAIFWVLAVKILSAINQGILPATSIFILDGIVVR
jgi:hypothetical protein